MSEAWHRVASWEVDVVRRVRRLLGSALTLVLVLSLGAAAGRPESGRPDVVYSYDAQGRLAGVAGPDGRVVYRYDPAGNLLAIDRYGSGAEPPAAAPEPQPPPVVAGFAPPVARPGDLVRVTGEHFTGDRLLDQVVLAGRMYAPVESAAPEELVVRVPPGAPSGVVSVATPAGTGQSPVELFVSPWAELPAEQISTTVRGEVGGAVDLMFAAAGESTLLVFEGAAGQVVSLSSSGDGLSCADLRVGLSTPDGEELRDAQVASRWCDGAPEEVERLPVSGTYAMLVSTRGQRTGSVRLHLAAVEQTDPVGPRPPLLPSASGEAVAAPEPVFDGAAVAPVDLATGELVLAHTDLVVDDVVPLAVSRSYKRVRRTPSRRDIAAFGLGSGLDYALVLETSLALQFADLALPGGQKVPFERVTPGEDPETALFLPVDASAYFGSRIVWNGAGWDLVLEDGTVLVFGDWSVAGLEAIRDRHGNQVTIERERSYLGPGNVRTVRSPSGRWLGFDYDDAGRVVRARDHLGRGADYEYDDVGLLSEVVQVDGARLGYRYDRDRRVIAVTGEGERELVKVGYDDTGRVVRQELADGAAYSFSYTTSEEVIELVDGARTVVEVVTEAEVVDPAGVVRRVEFAGGHWVSDTYGPGSSEEQRRSVQRDPETGFVTELIEPDGRRRRLGYDRAGNLVSQSWPDGSQSSYSYDPAWHGVASVTEAGGYRSGFGYDEAGNLVSETWPDGTQRGYGYDRQGRLVSVTGPDGQITVMGYELAHRVTVTDPDGHSFSEFYDAAGRLAAVTDPAGHITRIGYDEQDRVTAIIDPDGSRTSFAYGSDGYLSALSDPAEHTTNYVYDERGLQVSRTDPLGATDRYTYDESGLLVSHVDRRGVLTTLDYDGRGRPVTVSFGVTDDGGAESTIEYRYDAADRLVEVADSAYGTLTFGYDELDRVVSETTPAGEITYRYDEAGHRSAMVLPDGTETTYRYDASGLASISNPHATVAAIRDATGRVVGVELPGGVTAGYTYDDRGLVSGIDYRGPHGELGGLQYDHDAFGRVAGRSGSLARVDLPPAVGHTGHNAGNRITEVDGVALAYDEAGNLVYDGTHSYTWNARGELVAVDSSVTARYAYDPLGRRVAKTVDGITVAYLYDGWNIAQQQDPSGTTTYLNGFGFDERHARTTGDGVTHTYLTDVQGSVLGLAGPDGMVTTRYTYDPYGATSAHRPPAGAAERSPRSSGRNLEEHGAVDENRFGYSGRERDETGLYYHRHRYYHPGLGRFISEDPLGYAAGDTNLYAYGFNDPVNHIDPDGRQGAGNGACLAATAAAVGVGMSNLDQANELMDPDEYVPDDVRRRIELDRLHRRNMVTLEALIAICSFAGGAPGAGGAAAASRIGSFGRGLPSLAPRVPSIRPAVAGPRPTPTRPPFRRGCSFPGHTEVLLADGSTKPISEIAVDDLVVAGDPDDGTTGRRPVADVITGGGARSMVELTLVDGGYPVDPAGPVTPTPATIAATDNHPFWEVTEATWTLAAELQPGDQLLTPDGTRATVTATHTYTDTATVYNLTIADTPTYYALAGDLPVLVHNVGSGSCGPGEINVDDLRFSRTVENHLKDITRQGTPARPFMRSHLTMREIIRGSAPRPDPGGVHGAWRWDTPGAFNGRQGTWELVIDTRTNTVLHYNFTTG